ncbi:ABC transporter permease [Diplocloster modestus]|uniref:ABC transporter permease n=1 Tax=Diplocloster modestus TaxID=2850322 RepID=A0ABS6K1V1_9FIRM|nr:ABC transporter permease [Diplocloster modestus]MBU9724675.1 ABC transporter permease [Diplocloster modestus]
MNRKWNLKKFTSSRESSLVLILIVLCTLIQLRNQQFLTLNMFESMFKNYAVIMILALGMMCVLLIGGIDIAIGSTLGFAGMCASLIMRDHQELPVLVIFLISMGIGTAVGILIGCVISFGKVPPIIATLGGMYALRGLTYLVANSQWVASYQFTKSYKNFAQDRYLGFGVINNLVMITVIIYLLFFVFLKWTRTGRKIYAVGSNSEAAAVSGIRIEKIKILCYTIMGFLCGLCGAIYTSLYASAQGDMGTGLEMDVIAACVVGGVSLNGGRGSVFGVFLGALTMAIVGKALPLIGVSQFWQTAIKGFIIIVAIVLNVVAQRAMDKNNLRGREA